MAIGVGVAFEMLSCRPLDPRRRMNTIARMPIGSALPLLAGALLIELRFTEPRCKCELGGGLIQGMTSLCLMKYTDN